MTPPSQEEALKELIREANAATKDLRKAIKEGQDFLEKTIADALAKRIADEVGEGLKHYRETLDAKLETTQQAMFDRYDTLTNIMLGKGKPDDFEQMILRYETERQNNQSSTRRTT